MSALSVRIVDAAGVRTRVRLVAEHGAGRPVLVLHGFTGCAETMDLVIEAMAADRPVLAPDLVGHGGSDCPADVSSYGMDACVLQVAAVLDELQGAWRGQRDGPVHVIGYSMGGRLALSLALAKPEKVASLLLIGASPGLADPAARAARIEADLALARSIEDEGLARFVDYWMALPLFASQASLGASFLAASRSQRLRCNPLALANSLRGMGAGAMPPLHDDLERLDLPVCLVAGSRDVKFVALAESMQHRLPNARCAVVEGVGHAAHLEDADAFSQIARGFLAEVDDAMPAPSSFETRSKRDRKEIDKQTDVQE